MYIWLVFDSTHFPIAAFRNRSEAVEWIDNHSRMSELSLFQILAK